MHKMTLVKGLTLALVAAVMILSQGCADIGTYATHRYNDFGEMIDFGLTLTDTPQAGFYWNSLELITFGRAKLDGHFIGWGGGQIGYTRFYADCWGFIYGEETIGWGPMLDTDQREDVLIKRRSNVVGIFSSIVGSDPTGNGYGQGPNYTPACVHFFPHIGYVGIVWNVRYMEIPDFLLGWVGLDICGDDGYAVGEWSFPRRSRPPVEPAVYTPTAPSTTTPPAAPIK